MARELHLQAMNATLTLRQRVCACCGSSPCTTAIESTGRQTDTMVDRAVGQTSHFPNVAACERDT